MLEIKRVPVRNQRFDIGKTINPFLCDCEKCNFLHCPKNNYCVKYTNARPSFEEFMQEHLKKLQELNPIKAYQIHMPGLYKLRLTYDMIDDMISCLPKFPNNTYYRVQDKVYKDDATRSSDDDISQEVFNEIVLCAVRKGDMQDLGVIRIDDHDIINYDLSRSRKACAQNIVDFTFRILLTLMAYTDKNLAKLHTGLFDFAGFHKCEEQYFSTLHSILRHADDLSDSLEIVEDQIVDNPHNNKNLIQMFNRNKENNPAMYVKFSSIY